MYGFSDQVGPFFILRFPFPSQRQSAVEPDAQRAVTVVNCCRLLLKDWWLLHCSGLEPGTNHAAVRPL